MTTTTEVQRNAPEPGMTSADAGTGAARDWVAVCRLERLQPGRGAAALLGADQVALFRLTGPDGGEQVAVIDNIDPVSGAAVLSRGIVGDRGGEPVVASPVYKQAFSLRTGRCLDEPDREVRVYRAETVDGWVRVEPR